MLFADDDDDDDDGEVIGMFVMAPNFVAKTLVVVFVVAVATLVFVVVDVVVTIVEMFDIPSAMACVFRIFPYPDVDGQGAIGEGVGSPDTWTVVT